MDLLYRSAFLSRRLVPKLFYKCDQGQADPVVAVARDQSSVYLKLLMHETQPPSHFSVSTITRYIDHSILTCQQSVPLLVPVFLFSFLKIIHSLWRKRLSFINRIVIWYQYLPRPPVVKSNRSHIQWCPQSCNEFINFLILTVVFCCCCKCHMPSENLSIENVHFFSVPANAWVVW